MYECPAGEVLRTAHVGLEGLCLDREVYRLRDTLASRFTDYCYNGFWFSPEMEFVLHAVEKSQEVRAMGVCGCVWCRALTWLGVPLAERDGHRRHRVVQGKGQHPQPF